MSRRIAVIGAVGGGEHAGVPSPALSYLRLAPIVRQRVLETSSQPASAGATASGADTDTVADVTTGEDGDRDSAAEPRVREVIREAWNETQSDTDGSADRMPAADDHPGEVRVPRTAIRTVNQHRAGVKVQTHTRDVTVRDAGRPIRRSRIADSSASSTGTRPPASGTGPERESAWPVAASPPSDSGGGDGPERHASERGAEDTPTPDRGRDATTDHGREPVTGRGGPPDEVEAERRGLPTRTDPRRTPTEPMALVYRADRASVTIGDPRDHSTTRSIDAQGPNRSARTRDRPPVGGSAGTGPRSGRSTESASGPGTRSAQTPDGSATEGSGSSTDRSDANRRSIIRADGTVNDRVLDRLYDEIVRKMRIERSREGR